MTHFPLFCLGRSIPTKPLVQYVHTHTSLLFFVCSVHFVRTVPYCTYLPTYNNDADDDDDNTTKKPPIDHSPTNERTIDQPIERTHKQSRIIISRSTLAADSGYTHGRPQIYSHHIRLGVGRGAHLRGHKTHFNISVFFSFLFGVFSRREILHPTTTSMPAKQASP